MKSSIFNLVLAGFLCAAPAAFGGDALVTVTVAQHPVALSFAAESVVEAVRQTTVAAQISGRILEVRADAGQSVKKGEPLMRLDGRESDEAVRGAEAQYTHARLAYERSQTLKEKNFISQAALDKARADVDSAAANRAAAGASQSHAVLVAPLSGIVARRLAEQGDMATPGKPLFTLYQPGELRVTASVPQYRLQEMRAVKTARIEFPEIGKSVDARAVTLLPTLDALTHVAQVRVSLPPMAEVTPGMFARVRFLVGKAEKLTVPAAAIVRRGEVAAVYVQRPDQHLSLRQIRLGEPVGLDEIEVLAGLANGDKVVLDPVQAGIALKSAGQ